LFAKRKQAVIIFFSPLKNVKPAFDKITNAICIVAYHFKIYFEIYVKNYADRLLNNHF